MGAAAHPLEIIAHRGYSARAPENTLAAIEAALAAGADAVEFDLHVAADGTAVLFHDDTLDRTTDAEGALGARRADELALLDAGSWFGPAFAGEPVPTFGAALDACRGRVDRVYPEVKAWRSPADLAAMVREVRGRDMAGSVTFIAIDWTAIDHLRRADPGISVGWIVTEADQLPVALERARGDARGLVDARASLLLEDPPAAARFHDAGVPLAVWTVDDPAEAERLTELGVRRITTNEVERLLEWKRTRRADPGGGAGHG